MKYGFIISLTNGTMPLCLLCEKTYSNDTMKPDRSASLYRKNLSVVTCYIIASPVQFTVHQYMNYCIPKLLVGLKLYYTSWLYMECSCHQVYQCTASLTPYFVSFVRFIHNVSHTQYTVPFSFLFFLPTVHVRYRVTYLSVELYYYCLKTFPCMFSGITLKLSWTTVVDGS